MIKKETLLLFGQWTGIGFVAMLFTNILVMGFWKYVIHDIFGWGMISYMGAFFTSAILLTLLGLMLTLREIKG